MIYNNVVERPYDGFNLLLWLCLGYGLPPALAFLAACLPHAPAACTPPLTKCWQSTMPQSNDCCSLCHTNTYTHAQPLLAAASTPCLLLPSPFPHSLSLSRHFWQFVQNQSSATNAMQQQEQLTRHNCHIRQRQQRRRRRRRDVDVSANDDARLLQKSTPKKCSITKRSHEPIQVRAYVMLVLLLASCRERGYDATIETKKRIGGAVRKGMERFGIWHTALPDCATRGAPSVGAATHQTICMRCDSTGRDFVAQIK